MTDDTTTRYRVRVIIERRRPGARLFALTDTRAIYTAERDHVEAAADLAADTIALYAQEEGK